MARRLGGGGASADALDTRHPAEAGDAARQGRAASMPASSSVGREGPPVSACYTATEGTGGQTRRFGVQPHGYRLSRTVNSRSSANTSTWYALREFETRDITSRSYKSRHTLDLSATKAREISSNFIQAREYFRNASEADFTVRPLLLYYGVASLSRGLTLFLDPKKRETCLKPSHGLRIYDWVQELSSGLSKIGNLRIRLTSGLFHDLLTSTGNRFYFRHNSSGVNWAIGAQIPPTGI